MQKTADISSVRADKRSVSPHIKQYRPNRGLRLLDYNAWSVAGDKTTSYELDGSDCGSSQVVDPYWLSYNWNILDTVKIHDLKHLSRIDECVYSISEKEALPTLDCLAVSGEEEGCHQYLEEKKGKYSSNCFGERSQPMVYVVNTSYDIWTMIFDMIRGKH